MLSNMEDPTYEIDSMRIISEILDGEPVIIDFKNGSYYSLNNSGTVLWELVQKGHSKSQILRYLTGRFEGASDAIERSASALLSQLVELSLVAESPASDVMDAEPYTGPKQPFLALALQQFQDMQEMLLADPIHDVDETGWPTLNR